MQGLKVTSVIIVKSKYILLCSEVMLADKVLEDDIQQLKINQIITKHFNFTKVSKVCSLQNSNELNPEISTTSYI